MTLAKELCGVGMAPIAAQVIPNGTVAAVTATGSGSISTAIVLAAGINRITGSDSVKLPACEAGGSVICINDTGSTIKVFPPTGGAIQIPGTSFALAVVGTENSLTTYSTVTYTCVVAGSASLWAINKSA